LADINQVIVETGHEVVKKKPGDVLQTRCDSFVVETDVHYPTDINLLWDAMRKVVLLTGKLCDEIGSSEWRQYRFNLQQLKKRYRKAQKIKHSTSQNEEKRATRCDEVHQAYRDYVLNAEQLVKKSQQTVKHRVGQKNCQLVEQIHHYIQHAERQIDQIDRRVLKGETIPHAEKVFSIFEEHTE